MDEMRLPLTRDLVLIGGGHTHALVLRKWGMSPLPGARVTLINPGPSAPYSGMLPGHVAGHYDREELDIDLVRLARFANARIIFGAAEGIDLASRE
ncbi:MAG: bifunctional NADH dehydrogenase FAD-containing subunit/selenide, water dikinase SelD, partial [Litoreibacter sp.]|nr:bifunctional NADH dehydrogenase FAD-containing subunit/selenide, water dikinase SelD [Litoreibacter sp.]